MNVENDDFETRLEAQLGRELRGQLDGQLGRAAPYFLARCGARSIRRRRRFAATMAATAAAFIAAWVAWEHKPPAPARPEQKTVVVAGPTQPVVMPEMVKAKTPNGLDRANTITPDDDVRTGPPSADGDRVQQPILLGRAMKTRTRDEGILFVGRTPVRKVRRQWLERVEWFDPQNGARLQRIVPHEEVLFVPLPLN